MLGVGLRKALPCHRVLTLNVGLKFARLDAPLIAAANLDGGQVSGAHKRVSLHLGDAQELLNVCKGEESRCHGPILTRHP